MNKLITFLLCTLCIHSYSLAQNANSIEGAIKDKNNNPLLYANIINLKNGKGTISNEDGQFTIDISELHDDDIIRFQSIGYETKNLSLKDLKNTSTIILNENIYSLNEIIILGSTPKATDIVKNILENKDENYKATNQKQKIFIRDRSITEFDRFTIQPIKNNFTSIHDSLFSSIKNNTPEIDLSYTDFLGLSYKKSDSIGNKNLIVQPIKVIELESEEEDNLEYVASAINNTISSEINQKNENEYWKLKTGILSLRVNISGGDDDNEPETNDSIKNDTIKELKPDHYNYYLEGAEEFTSMSNEDQWDFLYNTKNYNFIILGGTVIEDEQVYIIEFVPKRSGIYEGRIYVSISTNALIRADYQYAEGKTGTNFNLLGIGYTQNYFRGSIFFTKYKDNYTLKYLSYQSKFNVKIKRKFSLIKKEKRKFLNKKLNEIKLAVDLFQKENQSIELLVLENNDLGINEFDQVKVNKVKKLYVDGFDEKHWKGENIITPTQQMKEYKKQDE